MYKKIFLDTLFLFIFIALFAVTFKTFFGIDNPYLQTIRVNGQTMQVYDLSTYFRVVNNSFNNFGMQLELEMPEREWRSVSGADWFVDLANNMAVMFNYLYMPINILLWPIRLLAWLIKEILILCGFIEFTMTVNGNTYQPEWFMQTLTFMSQKLFIPYL